MIFSLDGCHPDPNNPLTTGGDSARCRASIARNKALLEGMWAVRFRPPVFAKLPIPPRPTFNYGVLEPEPQTNLPDYFEFQSALNGELLVNALLQSKPTPAIRQLRDSGLALEAATEVLTQLRTAADALEEEVGVLKQLQSKQ